MLTPLVFLAEQPWPAITNWAFAYYFISITSALIYYPPSFLQFDFYRYDGNFILSFAPLLVLPLIRIKTDPTRILKAFVVGVTAINLAGELVGGALGQSPSQGLFVATNAFGGFLMFTTAASYVWWQRSRALFPLLLTAANALLMYISYSRGSEFGLALAIISVWLIRRDKFWMVAAMLFGICLIEAVVLYVTYPIYLHSRNIVDLINNSADSTKESNIMLRAFENWPRGLFAFFHSPIFGAGFGSVNDVPLRFSQEASLFQFNIGPIRRFDSAHAHNTYIQILGEQGLVGFSIFLGFWRSIYSFLRECRDYPYVRDVLHISFWALTYASFTEHRIPTPSNAFPFTLTLFLYYGAIAFRRLRPQYEAALSPATGT